MSEIRDERARSRGGAGPVRRSGSAVFRLLAVLFCLPLWGALCAGPAVGQQQPSQQDPFAAVKAAILANQLQPAREALTRFLAEHPEAVEGRFLLAEIETRSGHYDEAIHIYRRILEEHPEAVRVRLDMGRAQFLANQDREARETFRTALKSGVPEAVEANVRGYLNAIEARKRYYLNLSLAGIYDTDVNQAPVLNEVNVFGLPFTLSASAQAKEDPGLVISGNAGYWFPITERIRWRFDGSLYRNEFPSRLFDDMQTRFQAGPQYSATNWEVGMFGVFAKRWYGGLPYNQGAGPHVDLIWRPADKLLLENATEYLSITYHFSTFMNGFYLSDNLYTTYMVEPNSFVRLITGVAREHTENKGFSNRALHAGVAYHKEFRNGLILDVQPELYYANYDAENPIFGGQRRDKTVIARTTVADTALEIGGAVPFFSYIYTNNISSLTFYAYERHQFEIGATIHF